MFYWDLKTAVDTVLRFDKPNHEDLKSKKKKSIIFAFNTYYFMMTLSTIFSATRTNVDNVNVVWVCVRALMYKYALLLNHLGAALCDWHYV